MSSGREQSNRLNGAAARKAGDSTAEGHGLQAFRHANPSMMDRLGTPLKVRQERLGHSDRRITRTIYTHGVSEDSRKVTAQLGEAVWGILGAMDVKTGNGLEVEPPKRL